VLFFKNNKFKIINLRIYYFMAYVMNYELSDKVILYYKEYFGYDDEDMDNFYEELFKFTLQSPSWKILFDDESYITVNYYEVTGKDIKKLLEDQINDDSTCYFIDPIISEVKVPNKTLPEVYYVREESERHCKYVRYDDKYDYFSKKIN